jgi:hypothetical protein
MECDMQQLIPLTRPAELKAAGIPFETEDSARWAFRRRHDTGLASAFVTIGRRIYLDPAKFHELVRRGQAA